MHRWMSPWPTHLYLVSDTLVLWLMACLVWAPVVNWATLRGQKLLQCRDWVVSPEGLKWGLEALLFDFKELSLWNVASGDQPTPDPSLTEVDLSNMETEATHTTPVPPPFWPSNLHMASPQPSTYTSRGPWNGCNRLPPQPQPPSLSIVCLEGSHHLWPWGLCPPPEQKIH